ncbi:ribonuclease P/MRP protein subunit POP5 [Prorops nasuta]|uniref:ribonuclease P/MRP protein subunit POP5 n=1 Tax=Prorops nasuta TaxID=863751 RepID=UPI0034CFAD10
MVRFKNRYITVEIEPVFDKEKPLVLKSHTLQNAIQSKVQQMYGDFGVAAIRPGFAAKYCNMHTKIALIKIRHGPHKFLVNCIPNITDVGGHAASIKMIYVGATMKHCFAFIRKYQQCKLEKVWSTLTSEVDRKKMEKALMTLTPCMKDFK